MREIDTWQVGRHLAVGLVHIVCHTRAIVVDTGDHERSCSLWHIRPCEMRIPVVAEGDRPGIGWHRQSEANGDLRTVLKR